MNELVASLLRAAQHRFIGRLGADPDLKYFQSGSCVAVGRFAVSRPGGKAENLQPDWFKVEIWGEQGQAFADQCRKGQLIDVTGRVKTETWTDRNSGESRTQLTVTAEEWSVVGPTAPAAEAAKPATKAPAPTWVSSADDSNEDLPF